MYFSNILVAAVTFAIIGVFHPIVIKAEYYFGVSAWPVFVAVGLAFLVVSVLNDGVIGILLSIIGCACLWSVEELFEQKKRVEKGWFPKRTEQKKF